MNAEILSLDHTVSIWFADGAGNPHILRSKVAERQLQISVIPLEPLASLIPIAVESLANREPIVFRNVKA